MGYGKCDKCETDLTVEEYYVAGKLRPTGEEPALCFTCILAALNAQQPSGELAWIREHKELIEEYANVPEDEGDYIGIRLANFALAVLSSNSAGKF